MFDKNELSDAVKLLYQIVPAKTTMPILQTIKFGEWDNGKIELSATNLEASLSITLDCREPTGGFCVPARKFNELLGLLNTSAVKVERQDDVKVRVSKDKGYASFSTLESDEFPYLENKTENAMDIDTEILVNSLKRCLVAVSLDESHPVLSGVWIRSNGSILTMAAADGFRLSCVKLMIGLPEFEVIVPGEAAKFIVAIFKDEPKVKMSVNNGNITLWNSKVRFQSQLIAGNFPDAERIIPNEFATKVTCEKSEIMRKVKQAMIFAREHANIVSFEISDDEFKTFGNDGMNDDKGFVAEFDKDGPDIEIAVNGKFIQDALGLASNKVELRFNSGTSPIGIYIPDCETFTHVVMPMHLGRQ